MVLNSEVALVTGAGSGIGKSVAIRLGREGAVVVAADLSPESARATVREITAAGGSAHEAQVDVTVPAQLDRLVNATVENHGGIDILVACAGIDQQVNVLEISERDWDRVFDVNAKGVFFTLQAVARQMVRQGRGAIVLMSSGAGRGPRPSHAHYGASKAAVLSIARSAAAALAPHGITVNVVCPGIIATPMWDQIDREQFERFGVPLGEYRRARVKEIPLRRIGEAEDVAGAVAFLVSPEASYITGQALGVNGGTQML